MSVRGLVTVVIGIIAFVIIDSMITNVREKMASLVGNDKVNFLPKRGSLKSLLMGEYGNPVPMRGNKYSSEVRRDYTGGHPTGMKRESTPEGNFVEQSTSPEPTRAALTKWRCKNLPKSGNSNLQLTKRICLI